MNKEDRQKILHNLVQLVEQTNLEALIPVLLQEGVFTVEMGQKYMVSHIQQFFLCVFKTFRLSWHSVGIYIDSFARLHLSLLPCQVPWGSPW
jgi:hypothetical protein